MIFIQEQPEPPQFEEEVRMPGRGFLEQVPNPSTEQWKSRSYWQRILGELYDGYDGICAYTCHWIAPVTGVDTVDHFVPKSVESDLAYEWSNYRLVCARMNGRKGTKQDVLDPFVLRDYTFTLDFPSLQIRPSGDCAAELASKAQATILRLKLNDALCVKARWTYVRDYCKAMISFDYLAQCAPFIHREIVRQGLAGRIREVMSLEE